MAKAAAKLPQPHHSTSYKEVKTLLKPKQKSTWTLKNSGYDSQKDQINTLDRRTQITIFHLHTGHCGLRKHLKRLRLADSAHCECGSEEQTPEHILQTCPHVETVHQQSWPEDTEMGFKLWGQAAELQWTTNFLSTQWPEDLAQSSNAEGEGEYYEPKLYNYNHYRGDKITLSMSHCIFHVVQLIFQAIVQALYQVKMQVNSSFCSHISFV